MKLYKIKLEPQGGFYTPIKGDMLFGMFCRALEGVFGQERLRRCLDGYVVNRPFIVFSDVFPSGYLPKPCLPSPYYNTLEEGEDNAAKRKEIKRKIWIRAENINLPTLEMAKRFVEVPFLKNFLKTSNAVDPLTGHVSGGKYSAYTREQFFYQGLLDLYILIDENRITPNEVAEILAAIGQHGFGKKASSGSGKFLLSGAAEEIPAFGHRHNGFMSLAPSVPPAGVLPPENCFYKIFVRFGRHGSGMGGLPFAAPFKNPVVMMDTGAAFIMADSNPAFQGQGMPPQFIGTGVAGVSRWEESAVCQGYAPLVPLMAEEGCKNATV